MITRWVSDKTPPDELGYTQEEYERNIARNRLALSKRERRLERNKELLRRKA